jgi:gluconate kinase
MSLIFITGISTSGKSTMAGELMLRGYEAHDLEHNGISAWFHKEKGTRDAEFGKVPERTKEWADSHEWRVSMDRIHDIAKQSEDKLIFLCGGGANEKDIIALCDKVIWLKTDDETIRQRVNIPRDHSYGTKPHEFTAIIGSNKTKEREYEEMDAILVDARQPINEVVTDVIKVALQYL